MAEQMTLEGMRAFARAGTHGSFTAAARLLGVSQRLERSVGLSVSTRTTRSLVLTPEGPGPNRARPPAVDEVEGIPQAALHAQAEPAGALTNVKAFLQFLDRIFP